MTMTIDSLGVDTDTNTVEMKVRCTRISTNSKQHLHSYRITRTTVSDITRCITRPDRQTDHMLSSWHNWHCVCGVNEIGYRSRLLVTENVLPGPEMQWGLLKTVLTCHITNKTEQCCHVGGVNWALPCCIRRQILIHHSLDLSLCTDLDCHLTPSPPTYTHTLNDWHQHCTEMSQCT